MPRDSAGFINTTSHVDPAKAPGGGYDLGKLRAVQDWHVRYQLASVQGVAEVASIGGFVKQYQIELSSTKMRAANVSLGEVMGAVQNANLNVGGKVIEENGAEFVLRGIGLVSAPEDLELIAVKAVDGTPIYLKDIATVQIGGDFRRGALDINGAEAVGGTVVMRTGENAKAVIERVKARIAEVAPSLPPGISIKPFYDRSTLIDRTIDTLKHALVEEIILVTLAHIIFLWHFRSILIVTLPLPISILISFLLMKEFGITSNIMSLTGIAIAIGVLVDAAIVVTENVIRHCEKGGGGEKTFADAGGDLASHTCRLPASRSPDLLRDGDHHPRVRAGVRADRGRKANCSIRSRGRRRSRWSDRRCSR
jgi:Cu(I)/Ag(I) efflux system membrane protein CusA/SilA